MARVAVIGGGYGGVTVAKGLDPLADVVLIEQKDQFVHHAAALRAAVDTVWEHAIFMPYTNLLHRGEVPVSYTHLDVYKRQILSSLYQIFSGMHLYPFSSGRSGSVHPQPSL